MPSQDIQTNKQNNHLSLKQQSIFYSGPLPPADEFNKYALEVKDAPERILKMAENQQKHRMRLERIKLKNSIRMEKTGMVIAASITLVAMTGGFACIILGKALYGLAAILIPIATIVGTFLYQNRSRNKKRE